MFQNPSNLEVSFKFAEQAAARGDYEAAIGALERMLFFNPNLPRVKLELGVLYFKLGSWDLARGYFQDAIKGGDVPDDIRAQVNAYLAEIARRQAPYEFSALLHAGARWQSNANVGPDSPLVRAIGQDAVLNNQFAKAPDWNWFQLVAMQYNHKINKRGDSFEVIFTGYASQQHKFTQFDLEPRRVDARSAHRDQPGFVVQALRHRHRRDARPSQVHRIVRRRLLHSRTARAAAALPKAMSSTALAASSIRMNSRPPAIRPAHLTTAAINTELRFGFVRLNDAPRLRPQQRTRELRPLPSSLPRFQQLQPLVGRCRRADRIRRARLRRHHTAGDRHADRGLQRRALRRAELHHRSVRRHGTIARRGSAA